MKLLDYLSKKREYFQRVDDMSPFDPTNFQHLDRKSILMLTKALHIAVDSMKNGEYPYTKTFTLIETVLGLKEKMK